MPKVSLGSGETRKLRKVGENLTLFTATSTSRPGVQHFVIVYPDERGIQCTCEGWRYNSRCWHIDALELCDQTSGTWRGDSSTFTMLTCHYVKDHEGRHSWEV